ncbi:sensor domain-containing diguanylate cyclase [Oceanobacillus kapialis]|uniref:sensor domain-containing diguanylate cyclase n=1 Tax=Oceanobacillus kapialis TaxID=481353 RepID=UPI00384C6657
MKSTELLVDKLRSIYFNLVTMDPEQRDRDTLQSMAEHLKQVLPISYIGLYLFNEWRREYEMCICTAHAQSIPCQEQNLAEDVMMDKRIYVKTLQDKHISLLSILPNRGPKAIIVIEHKLSISMEELNIVMEETEKLISILQLKEQRWERSRSYLSELTSQLLSLTSRKKILSEILQGLKTLYPELTHTLLLSQDTEVESGLPVKTIEYSDDVTKRVSTLAFISGEVRIEEQYKETCCSLYAPLVGKQGVYGVLQVISDKGRYIPKIEADFIAQIASTAGKAIENVTLYEKSNLLVADLKLINDATHKLNSNLEMKEIVRHMRDQVIDVCEASEVGFIYYNGDQKKRYDVLTGSTAFFNSIAGEEFVEYILDHPACNGEPVFKGNFCAIDDFPYQSVMVIPMSHSGTVHGLIAILHQTPYFFTFSTFKLLQSLIQHSALAFTNTILKDKLERAVITDFLTKLYSRNYLEEKITDHMKTGQRGALILFDIDDFKTINDTYGHHIGDEVLKQVSNLIIELISKTAVAARWGGEELAVYVPAVTIEKGVEIASSICKQVEKYTNPSVTLSCGVSSWKCKLSDTVSELFIRADKALYEAKNIGKNCVVKQLNEDAK